MTLEFLNKERTKAMKTGDTLARDVIRSAIGNIQKVAIDKGIKDNITEPFVDEILLKEKKTLQEMIDTCPADRVETLELYKAKMAVLESYVPKLITDEAEVKAFIIKTLNDTIKLTKGNRGKIMKVIAPAAKGRVDMAVVNRVIGTILE